MSLFVLDTDMLSLYYRGEPTVVQRVDAHTPAELAISIVTVDEQLTGWYTLTRQARRAGWASPRLVVEHENRASPNQNQYSAWKLLCVDAELRVLVAYLDSSGTWPKCFPSQPKLIDAVQEVADSHPGKALVLISGEWENAVRDNGWQDVFSLTTLSSVIVP